MKFEKALASWRYFLRGERDEAIQILRQIEAHERNSGSVNNASGIRRLVEQTGQMIRLPDIATPPGIFLSNPERRMQSLILDAKVEREALAFIREWGCRETLRDNGLPARNTMLLKGPSGNGKTALAQAIAAEVNLPFAFIQYEGLIDSHLGETGKEIAKVFEFAARVPCVLFFDEADSVVCVRDHSGNAAEKEVNRATNLLMQKIDSLSPNSIVIFATNFPEVMDSALLRRIALCLELCGPDIASRHRMMQAMELKWPIIRSTRWREMADIATSFAGIESAAMDFARAEVMAGITVEEGGYGK